MAESRTIYDVIILGSGPAGLTASIYTARATLNTLVISGMEPGGQLTTTTEVENFPGFENGVQGPELMRKMRKQAEEYKCSFVNDCAVEVSGSFEDNFTVKTESNEYYGKSLIIAVGASAKWLGLENEQKLKGKGVSACATCDGYFFKDKIIAVVGGGDASMEEAVFLTKFASKVYLIARATKEKLRASKIMQQRAFDNNKIEFLFNTEVIDVLGENSVEGLKVINNITQEEKTMNDVRGLFVAIGHHPNTEFLKDFLELDEKGYLKVTNNTKTSVEGAFAAGDVHDLRYRQAITAAGYGCMAAMDTVRFLEEKGLDVLIPHY